MDKPGQWACIKEFDRRRLANSCVQNLRRGIVKVPKGQWCFISRDTKVYACYTEGLKEEEKAKTLNEV